MSRLGARSQGNLVGVHPDIIRLFNEAIKETPIDFIIIDGVRNLAEQKILFDNKATKTMRSRHLTGHAIDVVPVVAGEIRWDWPLYRVIALHVKAVAKKMNIKIEWGGDWLKFKDGPHWQLPWKLYPERK